MQLTIRKVNYFLNFKHLIGALKCVTQERKGPFFGSICDLTTL
jgi:hypothetical protein